MTSPVKTHGTYRPIENNEGQPIASSADRICDFWQWFGESLLVDDLGRPVVVYRGQHGANGQSGDFQYRSGSLSFGSLEAAKTYARRPNDRSLDPCATTPQVFAAYLRLERAAVNETGDPYVEFGHLQQLLGSDFLAELATDFSDEIKRTSNWLQNFDGYSEPEQVVTNAPVRSNDLYFLSYSLFDSAKWVDRIRNAGFDGTIHAGSGVTSEEAEYKVFCKEQAWIISRQMIDAR